MKVLELFGGIGAPRKALENIGVNVKLIDYVEILDWAVIAYNSMFNHLHKTQNVIGWNLNVDILIHGSPCQDFSIAGLGDVKNGGRSNLYTETLNIIKERLNPRPKVVVWENVKGLISKKHIEHFNHYLKSMEQMGYNNYYKVLIATDFGIPQKRERIFTVSISKDVDNGKFSFENLDKSQMKPLADFLENDVPINYFMKSTSMLKAIQDGKIKIIDEKTQTITTKQFRWNNAGVIKVPLTNFNAENLITNSNQNGGVQTITAGGANSRIKIAMPINNVKIEYKKYKNYVVFPRAVDGKCISGAYNRAWTNEVGTITSTNPIKILVPKVESDKEFENLPVFIIDEKPYHVRILTERECWRLMGFTDIDFDNVKNANVPKTGLYHLAGNSIVVQVLESIFKEIIKVLGGK